MPVVAERCRCLQLPSQLHLGLWLDPVLKYSFRPDIKLKILYLVVFVRLLSVRYSELSPVNATRFHGTERTLPSCDYR